MKLPILLGALLHTASPVAAEDFIYLRCKETSNRVIANAKTSKAKDDGSIDETIALKIDFTKKTINNSHPERPVSIIVEN